MGGRVDELHFIVIVTLRVWCRLAHSTSGTGLDDYITVLCNVVLLVTCVLITIGSHYGLGKRGDDLDPAVIPKALRWNVIISSVLIWVFSLPKFAIIAILKRILNYGTKTTILFWGLALTSQASILATSVWWWVQCSPVEFGWDKSIKGGKCADIKVLADLGYFTSAYSAFLDLFFALYPIPFIMRLNMSLKNRIAVSIALGLSSAAFIVSVYKLAIFGQVFEQLALDPTCECSGRLWHMLRSLTNLFARRPGAIPRHSGCRRRLHSDYLRLIAHVGPSCAHHQEQTGLLHRSLE